MNNIPPPIINMAIAQAQLSKCSVQVWKYKKDYVVIVKGIPMPTGAVKLAEYDSNGIIVEKEKDSDK